MSWFFGFLGFAILAMIWFVAGLAGSAARREALEDDLSEWEGVRDVRRESEDAKHDDLDAIERVRDKYNS